MKQDNAKNSKIIIGIQEISIHFENKKSSSTMVLHMTSYNKHLREKD